MKSLARQSRAEQVELDDGELVRRCLAGKRCAFEVLVRRHQKAAFGVAWRLLGDRHLAEDMTQKAFVKAWTSLGTLSAPDAFAGWLMRIVANLSLNARRSRHRRQTLSLEAVTTGGADGEERGMEPAGQDADPAAGPIRRELQQRLEQAIENLPDRQRLALVMFALEGMPQRIVAEALGTTEKTVKWLVFQARQQLRKEMDEYL